MNRNKLIAKIHVLKKELGLDTDTYRLVLYKITKKESCKELEEYELKNVIKELVNLANKDKVAAINNKSQFKFVRSNCNLMRKIFKQWQELGNLGALRDSSNKGLNSYLLKRYNKTYQDLNKQWLFQDEKNEIIESFKAWFAREAEKIAS